MRAASSIRKSSFVTSVITLFTLFLAFWIIWTPLYYLYLSKYDILFMPTPNETLMILPLYRQILEAVVLGPLLETLSCQHWMYLLLSLNGWFNRHKVAIILLGALIFGILHFFSISYIIYTFFMGLLFMSAYILRLNKNPYWTVAVIHALTNLFAILIDPVEKSVFGIT